MAMNQDDKISSDVSKNKLALGGMRELLISIKNHVGKVMGDEFTPSSPAILKALYQISQKLKILEVNCCKKIAMATPLDGGPGSVWMWQAADNGNFPQNAVVCGNEDGQTTYVARGVYKEVCLLGKLNPSNRAASVAFKEKELKVAFYDVLAAPQDSVLWVNTKDDKIPQNAIPFGVYEGEMQFIGRAIRDGTWAIGRVPVTAGGLYVVRNGREERIPVYQILTTNTFCQ